MIEWLKRRRRVQRIKKAVQGATKATKKRIVARGKRIAVQYRLNYSRKFGGKTYRLIEFETNKSSADKIAREERAAGISARVVPTKEGYAVYHRKG